MGQSYCTACNCKQKEDATMEVKSKPNLPYNSNIDSIQHSQKNSFSKPINEKSNLNPKHKVDKSIIEYYKKHIKKIIILQSMVRGFLARKQLSNFDANKQRKNFKEELNTNITKKELVDDVSKNELINNSRVSQSKIEVNEKRYVKDYLLKNGAKYSGHCK